MVSQVSSRLISPGLPHNASKPPLPPLFLIPRNHNNPLYRIKLLKDPSSALFKNSGNLKCLIISATISTVLILIIWCGITLRWLTRGLKFWPGYLHLKPRAGTRTFEPAGSIKWETGSYKLKNIGIGLVVFSGPDVIVQLYFATEVRGLARPTLGKRSPT